MRRAIFQEWCCQIESLPRLGVELSHLDAHLHVHTTSQLLPVLGGLRCRYKISHGKDQRASLPEHPPCSLWRRNGSLITHLVQWDFGQLACLQTDRKSTRLNSS